MNLFKSSLFCVLFFVSYGVFAQGDFSMRAGVVMPMGEFASDDFDSDEAGGAAVGFNFGIEYVYPIHESGLGIFGGLDFMVNGLQSDIKSQIEKSLTDNGAYNVDISYFKHINVPLSIGLNYNYTASEQLALYCSGGLTANFYKLTDMTMRANDQSVTTSFDLASSIGFRVGGGLVINDKLIFGINYYGLGNHDLDGEMTSGYQKQSIDGKQNVSMMSLSVGVKF